VPARPTRAPLALIALGALCAAACADPPPPPPPGVPGRMAAAPVGGGEAVQKADVAAFLSDPRAPELLAARLLDRPGCEDAGRRAAEAGAAVSALRAGLDGAWERLRLDAAATARLPRLARELAPPGAGCAHAEALAAALPEAWDLLHAR